MDRTFDRFLEEYPQLLVHFLEEQAYRDPKLTEDQYNSMKQSDIVARYYSEENLKAFYEKMLDEDIYQNFEYEFKKILKERGDEE